MNMQYASVLMVGVLSVAYWVSGAIAESSGQSPPNRPQTILVAIDLSVSNPLTKDPEFALRVAQRIEPIIAGLPPRSKVMLRSFGSYDTGSSSALTLDVTIAPKTARAHDISVLVAGAIASVPKMVKDGRIRPQGMTNIVPFLMNMSRVLNCNASSTKVILATDGVEDSEVANLARKNSKLPDPAVAPFPGCDELQMLGIGRGMNSPADTERLVSEWRGWSQKAGFRNFQGLNDW